jgi:hypothetical protein
VAPGPVRGGRGSPLPFSFAVLSWHTVCKLRELCHSLFPNRESRLAVGMGCAICNVEAKPGSDPPGALRGDRRPIL